MKLKYIKEYRDRTGRVRRYFRIKGQPDVALPGEPDSAEFMQAYSEALASADVGAKKIAASARLNGAGCIYFLDDGDFIKIGFSTDLSQRMKSYLTHRSGLNLVAVIPGSRPDDDKQIRRRFANLRARGDWFRKGPSLVAYVDKVKMEHPPGSMTKSIFGSV
jgi:hypothetical protein